MKGENKTPVHRWLLWAALTCALLASWSHVVSAFGRLEHGGPPAWVARVGPWASVLAAVALDLGLIALAWGIGQRRRLGRPAGDLWLAVGVFAGLSAFANAGHAFAVVMKGRAVTWAAITALDGWTLATVVGLAAALPLLALWLARVVELDADGDAGGDLVKLTSQEQARHEATPTAPAPTRPKTSVNGAGRTSGKRKVGPADLQALVTLDPAVDVTTLAGRLSVSLPTVYS